MEEHLNIYQKLNAVMKEVKYVQKEDKKVNGQYRFVSHDAVAAALHDPLANHGIVMVPTIADLVQDGNRTTVKMDISFINVDNPIDKLNVVYYGYGIDPQDKGIGKAVSYAVKYALLKTFCLETGDDVERDNIEYTPPEQSEEATTDQVNKFNKMVKDQGFDPELVQTYLDQVADNYKKSKLYVILRWLQDFSKFEANFVKWWKKNS